MLTWKKLTIKSTDRPTSIYAVFNIRAFNYFYLAPHKAFAF